MRRVIRRIAIFGFGLGIGIAAADGWVIPTSFAISCAAAALALWVGTWLTWLNEGGGK